ncbi:MAG: nucleotidyltransferase family protein [Candidatus Omnitrophica bacterium]|nr:nucleotidyltransferase family protein [Candidatus Omnitrophota bacterium]
MKDCDCVILCGGLGARLQSVVKDVPKVMAEVNGAPFLDLIVGHLKGQGIERVVLCTGYKANFVENYYRDHDFGITIDFSRENEPLGTGGALRNAREIISSDPFFVLNGDSFISVDLQAFLDFHREKKALASVLVSQVNQAKDFGSVQLDQSGKITGFCEKMKDDVQPLVNAGIYCFDQAVFSCMPEDEKFSLETDFFPALEGKEFYGYRSDQEFIDIGTPQRYESMKEDFKKDKNIGH